jgi:hypothetical protein
MSFFCFLSPFLFFFLLFYFLYLFAHLHRKLPVVRPCTQPPKPLCSIAKLATGRRCRDASTIVSTPSLPRPAAPPHRPTVASAPSPYAGVASAPFFYMRPPATARALSTPLKLFL